MLPHFLPMPCLNPGQSECCVYVRLWDVAVGLYRVSLHEQQSSGRAIVASGIAACSTLFIVGSGHGVGQCWLGIVPKIKKIPIKHGFIARNHKLPLLPELFCSVLVKYM